MDPSIQAIDVLQNIVTKRKESRLTRAFQQFLYALAASEQKASSKTLWADPFEPRTYSQTDSVCFQVSLSDMQQLGRGKQGSVHRVTLAEIGRILPAEVLQQLRAIVPSSVDSVAVKAETVVIKPESRHDFNGTRIQQIAGLLTESPFRMCRSILPVLLSFRCNEPNTQVNTEFTILPIARMTLLNIIQEELFNNTDNFRKLIRLLYSVYIEIAITIAAQEAVGIVHLDLHANNILMYTDADDDDGYTGVIHELRTLHDTPVFVTIRKYGQRPVVTDFGHGYLYGQQADVRVRDLEQWGGIMLMTIAYCSLHSHPGMLNLMIVASFMGNLDDTKIRNWLGKAASDKLVQTILASCETRRRSLPFMQYEKNAVSDLIHAVSDLLTGYVVPHAPDDKKMYRMPRFIPNPDDRFSLYSEMMALYKGHFYSTIQYKHIYDGTVVASETKEVEPSPMHHVLLHEFETEKDFIESWRLFQKINDDKNLYKNKQTGTLCQVVNHTIYAYVAVAAHSILSTILPTTPDTSFIVDNASKNIYSAIVVNDDFVTDERAINEWSHINHLAVIAIVSLLLGSPFEVSKTGGDCRNNGKTWIRYNWDIALDFRSSMTHVSAFKALLTGDNIIESAFWKRCIIKLSLTSEQKTEFATEIVKAGKTVCRPDIRKHLALTLDSCEERLSKIGILPSSMMLETMVDDPQAKPRNFQDVVLFRWDVMSKWIT